MVWERGGGGEGGEGEDRWGVEGEEGEFLLEEERMSRCSLGELTFVVFDPSLDFEGVSNVCF